MAWRRPFKTKSDFARRAADLVGVCCSKGHLTTQLSDSLFGRHWRITPKGLTYLFDLKKIEVET